MRSRPLMTLCLKTAPVQDIGAAPRGTRVTFPITGGSFEGERLRGKVLPGGYFRTVPRFETAEPKYAFLNRLLAIGAAEIRADGPVHMIEELL